jgi:hypothetical protein
MQTIVFIVIGGLALGVALAMWEWRRGRKLLRHDFNHDVTESGHLMAERERAINRPNHFGGLSGPDHH